jgi:uncharacterized protein (DUF362 family)
MELGKVSEQFDMADKAATAGKHKVIIRKCPDYENPSRIRSIVAEGMEELGAKPYGKVLLKPNVVFAHRRYSRFSYTHPAVIEALLDELAARPEVEKVIIGERTAIYMPTRYSFAVAGYSRFRRKPKVKFCFFDEDALVEVTFKKGSYHKSLRLPRTFVEADYKLYAPKLKHHMTSKLTCAIKLNIGVCDQKERLDGHDYHLEDKIADLYEVGYPNLVVVDAVIIGQQCEMVAKPLSFGVIMMGTSGVAVDSVAARLIGFDPNEIDHLRIARSRGWEPVSDDDIEIKSEVPLDELREKTKNLDRKFSNLLELDTPLRIYLGNYPGGNDICHGGCVNMLKGALATFEAYKPGGIKQAQDNAIVIGEYEGDVDGHGHTILLVGNCTKIKGEVNGKTKRIKGCPVGIPYFAAFGPFYCKLPNLYMDRDYFLKFPYHYVVSSVVKFINRKLR